MRRKGALQMSLNLVLDYENSALAAPQSFRDAMQAAAKALGGR